MDRTESYNNLCKARSPTRIYKYLNGSNVLQTFSENNLNIAKLLMNLINSEYFNTFQYMFGIVMYLIEQKGI